MGRLIRLFGIAAICVVFAAPGVTLAKAKLRHTAQAAKKHVPPPPARNPNIDYMPLSG